ncbi:MAG TPA: type 4a pilus biogenesis protein PilO [Thermoanaerobaculia bacterium]|nr:type 4a pilus biogenesis protein PilO [Thermoanaerobaculia bacterium]
MALKTGLEGKPWYFGLGTGLLIGLLLFGAGYWRMLQPKREEYDRLEAKLAELQTKIQEGRAARQELPKFREEVRQLELELDKLLRILPARRNTPDLMRRIRSLAEQGDFVLKRFNPGTLTDKEFYSEWPIAVDVEGTYHNLALFFDRISRFSRIINIENLEISALPLTAGTHTIASKFTAKTFVYKEPVPEEAPAPGAAAAPGAPAPAAAPESPASRIRTGGAGAAGGPD